MMTTIVSIKHIALHAFLPFLLFQQSLLLLYSQSQLLFCTLIDHLHFQNNETNKLIIMTWLIMMQIYSRTLNLPNLGDLPVFKGINDCEILNMMSSRNTYMSGESVKTKWIYDMFWNYWN